MASKEIQEHEVFGHNPSPRMLVQILGENGSERFQIITPEDSLWAKMSNLKVLKIKELEKRIDELDPRKVRKIDSRGRPIKSSRINKIRSSRLGEIGLLRRRLAALDGEGSEPIKIKIEAGKVVGLEFPSFESFKHQKEAEWWKFICRNNFIDLLLKITQEFPQEISELPREYFELSREHKLKDTKKSKSELEEFRASYSKEISEDQSTLLEPLIRGITEVWF